MLPLRISTFGGLSIQLGDQAVGGFISRKVEALLVYLAFERREHPREVLAELLWSDFAQDRAMANLRSALMSLQSQLADYLVVSRQTIMLNPECPCWLDAVELETAFKATDGGLTRAHVRTLENALELYRGEFLAGFAIREAYNFEGWMVLQAERLRGKVIEGLQRLIHEARDHGAFAAGIDHARRLLILDPLSEETHRDLMILLARSGQRTAALAQYEACVRMLREELDIAPEAETTRLFAQIQAQQFTSAPTTLDPIVRIPIPSTPFVERSELKQIVDVLDNPDCRLLSIVGPGGIGKTRLAIQAGMERAHEFRDGVNFVSLISVQSENFLPLEIASAMHFSFQGILNPREELIGYLANRETLLILDNFEHLVNGAGLLADILARAPSVKILVTSREWLNLQQEWVVPIDGMAYPLEDTNNAMEYSAVQLFVACARRVRPRFSFDDERKAVIQICQLVEGMPLSIELAATWLRIIPASEIVQQINVDFLTTNIRNVPERHRSARAVFDYSWKLLSSEEAVVLRRLAVFKGPFDRTAAAKVAGTSIAILASLVEKSLIRLVDERYYDIHELMRQYAFDELAYAGEVTAIQDIHLDYYVNLMRDPDSLVHGQSQTEWLDRLEKEHDNLRTALTWALQRNTQDGHEAGLKLGASLWEFWSMRGYITEGRQWLDRLLSATEGTISISRGAVTQGAGYLAWIQGEHDRAEALHQEGLAMRQALNDKAGMGGSLSNLGIVAWSRGDFEKARSYYEQALASRREANYALGVGSVLTNLALLLQEQGEYAEAVTYAEEALAVFTKLDDLQGKSYTLINLGSMMLDQGDWERGRSLYEEALDLTRKLGDGRMIGAVLQNLAHIAFMGSDYALAHRYLDESLSLVDESGDKTQIGLTKKTMARLALLEARFDDAQKWIKESISLFRSMDSNLNLGQALLVQGDLQQALGKLTAAEESYRDGLALLFRSRNPQPIVEGIYRLAHVAAQQEPLRAITLLSAADTLADRLKIYVTAAPMTEDRAALQANLDIAESEHAVKLGQSMILADLAEYIGIRNPSTT